MAMILNELSSNSMTLVPVAAALSEANVIKGSVNLHPPKANKNAYLTYKIGDKTYLSGCGPTVTGDSKLENLFFNDSDIIVDQSNFNTRGAGVVLM